MAENCTGTLQNLYTLRGAAVRDGAAWAKYITEYDTINDQRLNFLNQGYNSYWISQMIELPDACEKTSTSGNTAGACFQFQCRVPEEKGDAMLTRESRP